MKGQEEIGEKDVCQKKKKEEKLISLCRKSSDKLLRKKLEFEQWMGKINY